MASDGTRKIVYSLHGDEGAGGSVETVLIPMSSRAGQTMRYTACVSSQVRLTCMHAWPAVLLPACSAECCATRCTSCGCTTAATEQRAVACQAAWLAAEPRAAGARSAWASLAHMGITSTQPLSWRPLSVDLCHGG